MTSSRSPCTVRPVGRTPHRHGPLFQASVDFISIGYGGPGAVHRFTVGEDDAQMRAKLLHALACRHAGFD